MNASTELRTPGAYGRVIADGTVRIERTLPGPIERVWDFLVDAERRGEWLARGPMEPRVGGAVTLRFNHAELSPEKNEIPEPFKQYDGGKATHGRVTRWEPPRVLAYTWEEESATPSEVTFELKPQDDDVQLVVTHARLATPGLIRGVSGGWHTHLDVLVDRLRGDTPRNFWKQFAIVKREYERLLPP